MLEICYKDEFIVAINKPNGLLVHRSSIATNTDEYALQLLRDQIGQKVYPCHRLDRKTSGVLIFALNPEVHKAINDQFMLRENVKKYLAIVRGYTIDNETIDYPLTNLKGKSQDAVTSYTTLKRSEIPVPFGKHETSRYSLLEVVPKTGRTHQIRKHLAHIFHPIIGDRPHGCNKQNRFFLEQWNHSNMLLHHSEIEFKHPVSNELITISAELPEGFLRMQGILSL